MQAKDWNHQETLFAFMGWLTSRTEETHLSAHHDAAPAVDLITRFAERHGLTEQPRAGWERAIVPEVRES